MFNVSLIKILKGHSINIQNSNDIQTFNYLSSWLAYFWIFVFIFWQFYTCIYCILIIMIPTSISFSRYPNISLITLCHILFKSLSHWVHLVLPTCAYMKNHPVEPRQSMSEHISQVPPPSPIPINFLLLFCLGCNLSVFSLSMLEYWLTWSCAGLV